MCLFWRIFDETRKRTVMTPPPRPSLARRFVATGAACALLTGVLITGTVPLAAVAATGTVTGTVFRDFNGNGAQDSGNAVGSGLANDTGLAGVSVTATDDAGTTWTTTSAADGTYTLPVTNSSANTVRVQFTGLPAGYEDGAVHGVDADNKTAVRFVTVNSTDVDFAANTPEDYTQPGGAPLVTAIQWAGSPFAADGGTKGGEPALAGIGYDDGYSGPQPDFAKRVTLATYGEVGSISANVFQSSSNSVFAAATYKRNSGLGELGLGGIYRITDVRTAANGVSGDGEVIPWLDVTDIGIDVGTALTNAERGLKGPQAQVNDPDAFAKAGKVGIGDMTLSPDGNTLFFVNLFDKKLYSIDIVDPTTLPTAADVKSYDLGLGAGERPWALTIYRGEVFVGFVDSGETADGSTPGLSADAAGLGAHVIKAPLSGLGTWTDVFTGDLGYKKGDVYNNVLAPQSRQWNTWADTWTWTGGSVAQSGGGWQIYPQPILSDLYFDEDGYLSLGFTDRTSIQGGNRSVASDPSVPGTNFEAGASGDLLIASPNADGTFLLENDGTVGDRTTTSDRADQGPGGKNFYDDGQNLGASSSHQETTLGQLAGIRGTREVLATAYDPLASIRAAGLMWDTVDTGTPVRGYELTPDGGGNGAGGNFQKGGGLGGISILAALAPVEIGNRIWFDADKDGIQDPSEPSVAGVTVELVKDGEVIGTTTTNAQGEYYFSSDDTSEFFVDGFVANGGEYTVRFVKPTSGNILSNDPVYGTVPWSYANLTSAEATSTETGSNPNPATGEYTFTVGGPGQNDHSIDAGFILDTTPTVDIEKGDGTGETIDHDADTVDDSETYAPGETRTIVFAVTNTGDEPLRNVVLTDDTLDGADVKALTWTMPDGSTVDAVEVNGVLTARWQSTFAPGTTLWAPEAVITGTATLTAGAGGSIHLDRATVTAVGAYSAIPVDDEDDYNAHVPTTPAVEVPPTTSPTPTPAAVPSTPAQATPTDLASTGAAVLPVIIGAFATLLAGAAALIATMRRRKLTEQ